MYFFIYALEELYSHHYNGYDRVFTSIFTHSEIMLGGSIFWNRNSINSIKRAVPEISSHDNQEQVEP